MSPEASSNAAMAARWQARLNRLGAQPALQAGDAGANDDDVHLPLHQATD
jgi:hypothetical protein